MSILAAETKPSADLAAQAAAAMRAHAELAKDDPLEFNAFVLKDEDTGGAVENAPCHVGMHEALEISDRVLVLAHIESGKTTSITVGRTLWELTQDPNLRGAVVSAKEELAAKPVRQMKALIEHSPEFEMVAPHIKRGPIWQENKFVIERPNAAIRDPSVIALGMNSKFLGARYDWVVVDDLLNERNTRTAFQRNEVYDWFLATVMGRLTRKARLIIVNTAWHEQDLIHRLARRKIWYLRKFPVCTFDAKGEPVSTWPDRWPKRRIKDKFEELGGPTAKETRKQLLVEGVSEDDQTFDEAGIQRCLKRGIGVHAKCASIEMICEAVEMARPRSGASASPWTAQLPTGRANEDIALARLTSAPAYVPVIVHGLDLGGRRNAAAGKTVLTTLAIHEDGTRQPVRIVGGRLTGPQIRDLVVQTNEELGGVFMVENNGVQQWLIEFTLEQAQIPIVPFTTGNNKADPQFGVESLAIEMANGSWVLPCTQRGEDLVVDDELGAFLDGLRDFSPETHTSDYLMSAWFARELARRMLGRRKRTDGNVGVRVIGTKWGNREERREARRAEKSERSNAARRARRSATV